jgi:hypothetical protein
LAFLLNETESLDLIEAEIDLGFNGVIVEGEHFAPEEYQELVKRVVHA